MSKGVVRGTKCTIDELKLEKGEEVQGGWNSGGTLILLYVTKMSHAKVSLGFDFGQNSAWEWST
jgi:hypothetical protein